MMNSSCQQLMQLPEEVKQKTSLVTATTILSPEQYKQVTCRAVSFSYEYEGQKYKALLAEQIPQGSVPHILELDTKTSFGVQLRGEVELQGAVVGG
jgi:hypothetical protein